METSIIKQRSWIPATILLIILTLSDSQCDDDGFAHASVDVTSQYVEY